MFCQLSYITLVYLPRGSTHLTMDWAPPISISNQEKCPNRVAYRQSEEDTFSTEDPLPQITLTAVKLIEKKGGGKKQNRK